MNVAPKIIKDEGYSIFNLVVIFHPDKGPKNIEHAIYIYIIVGKVWSITAYTLSIKIYGEVRSLFLYHRRPPPFPRSL